MSPLVATSDNIKQTTGAVFTQYKKNKVTMGTAFVIHPNGYIITCWHTVREYYHRKKDSKIWFIFNNTDEAIHEPQIKLYYPNPSSPEEELIYAIKYDLAILKIEKTNQVYSRFGILNQKIIDLDRRAVSIISNLNELYGHQGQLLKRYISDNLIPIGLYTLYSKEMTNNNYNGYQERKNELETSEELQSHQRLSMLLEPNVEGGISGGPVLHPNGDRVIGIVYASQQKLNPTTIAIHGKEIRKFFETIKEDNSFAVDHDINWIDIVLDQFEEVSIVSINTIKDKYGDEYRDIALKLIPTDLEEIDQGNIDLYIDLSPDKIELYRTLFTEMKIIGDERDKDHESMIRENPRYQQSWYVAGNYFYLINDYEKALQCYKQLLHISPLELPSGELAFNPIQFLINKGQTYQDMGNYEKAIENYSNALDIKPELDKQTMILLNRAVCYQRVGKFGEKLEDEKTLLDMFKDAPKIINSAIHIKFHNNLALSGLDKKPSESKIILYKNLYEALDTCIHEYKSLYKKFYNYFNSGDHKGSSYKIKRIYSLENQLLYVLYSTSYYEEVVNDLYNAIKLLFSSSKIANKHNNFQSDSYNRLGYLFYRLAIMIKTQMHIQDTYPEQTKIKYNNSDFKVALKNSIDYCKIAKELADQQNKTFHVNSQIVRVLNLSGEEYGKALFLIKEALADVNRNSISYIIRRLLQAEGHLGRNDPGMNDLDEVRSIIEEIEETLHKAEYLEQLELKGELYELKMKYFITTDDTESAIDAIDRSISITKSLENIIDFTYRKTVKDKLNGEINLTEDEIRNFTTILIKPSDLQELFKTETRPFHHEFSDKDWSDIENYYESKFKRRI